MTYKEIVDRFKSVADSHYMIKDFGYGQLSDIKVHSQDQEADYPYMFLNPTTHNRNGVVLSYNFNLIMMDIATDEDDDLSNFLAIQSKCTQYIDDVIAEMYYGYSDKPEINYSNISYTTFKERFQDSVAGVTATITIDVPTPINQCIAPIAPPPVPPVDCIVSEWSEWSLCVNELQFRTRTVIQEPAGAGVPCGDLIEIRSCVPEPCNLICEVALLNQSQIFNPETGLSPLMADTIILDTYNGWRPLNEGGNFYMPKTFDSLTWTITGVVKLWAPDLLPGDTFPLPFTIEDVSNQTIYLPSLVIGWPTEMPEIGAEFPFTLIYDNLPVNSITSGWQAVIMQDTPLPQAAVEILPGVVIEICQTGVVPPPQTLIFDGDYIANPIFYDGIPLQVQQPYNVYDSLELGAYTDGVGLQVNSTGEYRIVFDAILQNEITEAFYQSQVAICPTECFIDPPLRWHVMKDLFFPLTPSEVIGFPWTFDTQTGVNIPVTYNFTVTLQALKFYKFDFSTAASPFEGAIISMISGNIKMYKL